MAAADPLAAAATAAVVALALCAAYYIGRRRAPHPRPRACPVAAPCPAPAPPPAPAATPLALLNNQIDAMRGSAPSHGYKVPAGTVKADRFSAGAVAGAAAAASPEDIFDAERGAWDQASSEMGGGHYEPNHGGDAAADALQHHTAAPAIDYDAYVTDLMIDGRTRENHKAWVNEMTPWSGVAKKVDNLEMESYLHFAGLRRPQAVAINNPQMLTEIDTSDLVENPKFNFKG